MAASRKDPFGALTSLDLKEGKTSIYSLAPIEKAGLAKLDRLPFSIRILLENALRHCGRGDDRRRVCGPTGRELLRHLLERVERGNLDRRGRLDQHLGLTRDGRLAKAFGRALQRAHGGTQFVAELLPCGAAVGRARVGNQATDMFGLAHDLEAEALRRCRGRVGRRFEHVLAAPVGEEGRDRDDVLLVDAAGDEQRGRGVERRHRG